MPKFVDSQSEKIPIGMARHNDLGKWGEQLAADLLVTKGYAIAERNWRAGNMEIDIVAMKGARVVFCPVDRDFDAFGRGQDEERRQL